MSGEHEKIINCLKNIENIIKCAKEHNWKEELTKDCFVMIDKEINENF